jgi:putative transposase
MHRRHQRRKLQHRAPDWVADGSIYFITVNTSPPGLNQLAVPGVARQLLDTVQFRAARGEWYVHLMLFMPDHLHALMSFPRQTHMSKSIAQWKRYAATMLGIRWQRDFFDHRLRQDESYLEKAHYIRMNPVRKGLCREPADWPYVWEGGALGERALPLSLAG